MDLNQLLYHHQMALIAANRAHRDGHPASNFDLPRYYAKRISEYRARRGIGVGPAPMADREGSNPRSDPRPRDSATLIRSFLVIRWSPNFSSTGRWL